MHAIALAASEVNLAELEHRVLVLLHLDIQLHLSLLLCG